MANATPLQRDSYLAFEEKQYKDVVAEVEGRVADLKAALDIARKREGKRR